MSAAAAGPAQPGAEALPEDEVRARILAATEPLPAETTPLARAVGRFAAVEVRAGQALPGFDNSAMDGYAVAFPMGAADLAPGTVLRVQGEQAAGPDRGLRVEPRTAVRIFTGAPMPAGSAAIVMQEDVERNGDEITLKERVKAGEFIRRAGGDLTRGQRLFAAGSRLTPQRIGLLASQGLADVAVGGVPRVAILTTGDELRAPGRPLASGEIYESNGAMLAALVETTGARVSPPAHARDDRADLDAKLAAALEMHDVLIVAGGVSVGERDFVKERLRAAGVAPDLWRVHIQPGKPFLYGRVPGQNTHVFGLPGNPVSSFVTFLLFVRPALLRLAGAADELLPLPSFPASAGEALSNHGNRPHYFRGTLDTDGKFRPGGRQESHALFALSQSNALARVEPGAMIPPGGAVRAHIWEV